MKDLLPNLSGEVLFKVQVATLPNLLHLKSKWQWLQVLVVFLVISITRPWITGAPLTMMQKIYHFFVFHARFSEGQNLGLSLFWSVSKRLLSQLLLLKYCCHICLAEGESLLRSFSQIGLCCEACVAAVAPGRQQCTSNSADSRAPSTLPPIVSCGLSFINIPFRSLYSSQQSLTVANWGVSCWTMPSGHSYKCLPTSLSPKTD